jgi:FkbM family methyltransferase
MSNKYPVSKAVILDNVGRTRLTVGCRDSDVIPKVAHAGGVQIDASGKAWQRMHNGLLVEHHGYYGDWMAEIIATLRGHHEPQEERAFWEILKRLDGAPTMVELGAFWAYYSLWFKHDFPNGRCHMYEPNPAHSALGQRNFARNGQLGYFEVAAAGQDGIIKFYDESLGQWREVVAKSAATICAEQNIGFLDILHMDVQGAELAALFGAEPLVVEKRLRFVVISTHHHSISGDPLTHQRCLQWLLDHGAHILCEHGVNESFSGDGLIVASFSPEDANAEISISHCRVSQSLFRELEFDLAEAKTS